VTLGEGFVFGRDACRFLRARHFEFKPSIVTNLVFWGEVSRDVCAVVGEVSNRE